MAKPVADRDEINTGLQEVDGGAMAQGMGVYPLTGEAGHCRLRQLGVFAHEVADPEAGEGLVASIAEESLG